MNLQFLARISAISWTDPPSHSSGEPAAKSSFHSERESQTITNCVSSSTVIQVSEIIQRAVQRKCRRSHQTVISQLSFLVTAIASWKHWGVNYTCYNGCSGIFNINNMNNICNIYNIKVRLILIHK